MDDYLIHCAVIGNKFLENFLSSYDILSHHGIAKQKWGVKNGPPYPLAAKEHSKAQIAAAKKAGVQVGKSTGKYSSTSSKKISSTTNSGKSQNEYINYLIKSGKAKINDLKDYKVGDLIKFSRDDHPGESWVSGLTNGKK